MSRSTLIVSAGVVLYVNGNPYARVLGFQWGISTPRNALHGIDAITPFELALTSTSVSGSLTVYRQSQDGGAEGAGFTVTMPELPREKYFSMMLIEPHTNTILFEARQCSVESQSWQVALKSYVIGSISFSAISASNEIRNG
jgi:hypothetical protein